jgi:hypothetical protein
LPPSFAWESPDATVYVLYAIELYKRKYNGTGVSRLNTDVKDRGEEREEKQAVSLLIPSLPHNYVRETCGLCINIEELTTIQVG